MTHIDIMMIALRPTSMPVWKQGSGVLASRARGNVTRIFYIKAQIALAASISPCHGEAY